MAIIGSRAIGTRVPKGGGFGPALEFPQNGLLNPDAPQPASERRRENARIKTTKSLQQGIAANTVTAAHIETAKLNTDGKVLRT